MYKEKIGTQIHLDSQTLSTFISFPTFSEEEKEYQKIMECLHKKIKKDLSRRHYFILVNDWWTENFPSCWLSFHLLKSPVPTLIASMRSCNMKTFGSDLGFLARLSLSIQENITLIWQINSLHIEED